VRPGVVEVGIWCLELNWQQLSLRGMISSKALSRACLCRACSVQAEASPQSRPRMRHPRPCQEPALHRTPHAIEFGFNSGSSSALGAFHTTALLQPRSSAPPSKAVLVSFCDRRTAASASSGQRPLHNRFGSGAAAAAATNLVTAWVCVGKWCAVAWAQRPFNRRRRWGGLAQFGSSARPGCGPPASGDRSKSRAPSREAARYREAAPWFAWAFFN
jgi:hypothetical protein